MTVTETPLPSLPASAGQTSLPLDAPPLSPGAPLLPARMVNEYVYCPRLAYLEWVQGEWADSADTVEGKHAHRRVDKPTRANPLAGVNYPGRPATTILAGGGGGIY